MGKINLSGYVCERCGHTWISRNKNSVSLRDKRKGKRKGKEKKEKNKLKEKLPIVCPKCKSPYWNIPRKNKKISKRGKK